MLKAVKYSLLIATCATPVFGNELFGYKLLSDIRKYHNDLSGAEHQSETYGGYNQLYVNPIIPNAAFSDYYLDYDTLDFSIHTVMAYQFFAKSEYCNSAMESWVPRLEERFGRGFVFDQWDDVNANVRTYAKSTRGYQIDIRCNTYYDNNETWLLLIWRSDELWNEIERYYDNF